MGKNLMGCVHTLKNSKSDLRSQYHIESIAIFGSVTRRQNHRPNDIDILVRFSQLPSFFELAHLENFLSKRLQMKIDLVIENGADKRFLDRIAKDLVSI